MKPVRTIVLSCALASWCAVAPAVPVHYDESVDGDLDFGGPLIGFDVGVNTFTGTFRWSTLPGEFFDFDAFDFTIPHDTRLVGVRYSVGAASVITNTAYAILDYHDLGNELVRQIVAPPFDGPLFDASLPIGAGDYRWSQPFMGGSVGAVSETLAYTLSFVVAAVPEPTTLVLLALGVAGTGFGARRRPRRRGAA